MDRYIIMINVWNLNTRLNSCDLLLFCQILKFFWLYSIRIGWDYSFFPSSGFYFVSLQSTSHLFYFSTHYLFLFLFLLLLFFLPSLPHSASSHSILLLRFKIPKGRFWESASRRIRWYWHGWNESTYTSTYNCPIIVWKRDYCSVRCLNSSVILFHFNLMVSHVLFVNVSFILHVMYCVNGSKFYYYC